MRKIEAQKRKVTGERGLYAILFGVFLVLLLAASLHALELMPEFQYPQFRPREVPSGADWLGMKLTPLTRDIRKEFFIPRKTQGVFVSDVGEGEARSKGVMTGDVIVSINGKTLKDLPSFVRAADFVRFQDGILLDLFRGGKNQFVSIPYVYDYGPLMGPHQGRWQMGGPLMGQVLPYGRPPVFPNNTWKNGRRQ